MVFTLIVKAVILSYIYFLRFDCRFVDFLYLLIFMVYVYFNLVNKLDIFQSMIGYVVCIFLWIRKVTIFLLMYLYLYPSFFVFTSTSIEWRHLSIYLRIFCSITTYNRSIPSYPISFLSPLALSRQVITDSFSSLLFSFPSYLQIPLLR